MRKLKWRDERKRTLDTRIYSMVRIATKAPLRPRCWNTHEEYRFPAIKSLPWTQSRSSWSRSSLREIAHKGRGLRPPHNVVDAAPHQAGGSLTCRRATKTPRRPAHRDTTLVHFRTTAQGSKPYLITHSRANVALTLTKLVLRTKDLNSMLLDGLEVFLGVCVMSWDSSKLQMARGTHTHTHIYIYRPPCQESRY